MKKLFREIEDSRKSELIKKVVSVISHETQTDLLIVQSRVMGLLKKYQIAEEDLKDIFTAIKGVHFFNDMSYMNCMDVDSWDELFPAKIMDVTDAIKMALAEFPLMDIQKFKIEILSEDSFNLKINEKLFAHMLQNILKNALFFSSANNKDKVLITTDASDPEKNFVIISNNGPEIDVMHKEKIFDAYTTTRLNGLGMGLYSVKRIAEYFSADVTVMNRLECEEKINIPKERIENVNFVILFNKKLN